MIRSRIFGQREPRWQTALLEKTRVEGFDFAKMPVGTRFCCNDVVLEMTQIGKKLRHGYEIFQIMGDCIMPREGVFTKVLHGGVMRPGDEFICCKRRTEESRTDIFETHDIIDNEAFDQDRELLLESMEQQEIRNCC